jgi:hypothetical protein
MAPAPRNRVYNEAVRQGLIVLWEAGDRVCGKRLKVMIPLLIHAMERHGHLFLDAAVNDKLLQMSAASIDRLLRTTREQIDGKKKRRAGVGSSIRRSIPVRTFADWGDPPPGYLEVESAGEIMPPCGVPASVGKSCRFSIYPAFSHFWRIALSIGTFATNHSWEILSKHASMSPSKIHSGAYRCASTLKHCAIASAVDLS